MDKKRRGFEKLISVIGIDFFNDHRDRACFSCGDTEQGLYCFLGIDLHPQKQKSLYRQI